MPYQITYTENPNILRTRFFDVLTDEELKQSCDERTSSTELLEKQDFIIDDFADVTTTLLTMTGVQYAIDTALKASTLNKHIKYLAIMPTDILFGFSRVWHAHTDDTEWERNIVRTREEAEAWLQEHQHRA